MLKADVVPEDTKGMLPLSMVEEVKHMLEPAAVYAAALQKAFPWLVKAALSRAYPIDDDVKYFLDLMTEPISTSRAANAATIVASCNVVLGFVHAYAKARSLEAVICWRFHFGFERQQEVYNKCDEG